MKPTNKYFISVSISEHACDRARQRFRWNEQTLQRMSEKAYKFGLEYKNSNGYLKKYFEALKHNHKANSTIKLYGETIFIFYSHTLVTMWQLPLMLRPIARALKGKHKLNKPKFFKTSFPFQSNKSRMDKPKYYF